MAPNLIGSTFILAETAIANSNSNDVNNNKSMTIATTTNDRIRSQGEPVVTGTNALKSNGKALPAAKSDTVVSEKSTAPYKVEIVWVNVFLFIILHSAALYGLWLVFAENAYVEFLFSYLMAFLGGLGITAGVHRLWSHRSYKAKMPLRIFLMLCQSLAFQNSIYEWTRDHRVHHKFTDTNADPHNSKRGFFFSHMGWLLCKKHPDVKEKGKLIDMSDLKADPVVMFQKKYYYGIMPICCFVLPALFPYFYVGSSLSVCFFVCSMLRYCVSLHATWLVNSAAHFYGMRPFDKAISSAENKAVAILAFGEGWHNYHHVFPWDYKAAELGNYQYNWTTAFLNLMAAIGQAYDLKTVSKEMVLKRVQRTGDGTHYSTTDVNNNSTAQSDTITDEMVAQLDHDKEQNLVWGWDDKDICEEDRRCAFIKDKKAE